MPRKPESDKPAMSRDDLSPSEATARARKPAKPRAVNVNKVSSSKKPATTAAKKPVKAPAKRKPRTAKPAMNRTQDSERRKRVIAGSPGAGLVEELLGADEADLGDAQALRGRHDAGHVLVLHELVGAQVEFRLHRHL